MGHTIQVNRKKDKHTRFQPFSLRRIDLPVDQHLYGVFYLKRASHYFPVFSDVNEVIDQVKTHSPLREVVYNTPSEISLYSAPST